MNLYERKYYYFKIPVPPQHFPPCRLEFDYRLKDGPAFNIYVSLDHSRVTHLNCEKKWIGMRPEFILFPPTSKVEMEAKYMYFTFEKVAGPLIFSITPSFTNKAHWVKEDKNLKLQVMKRNKKNLITPD
jgi:hypothetical protein